MDAEIDSMTRIEDSHFCLLGECLPFVRFSLSKINNRCGQIPERITECAVEFWCPVDAHRFRETRWFLGIRRFGCGNRSRAVAAR